MTTQGGSNVGSVSKPSPLQVGLQVSRGIRSQTAPESDLREDTPAIGSNFPRVGETEGRPDCGRASDAGPCAHVYRDSTRAPSRLGDWVPEGEECHCDCTPVRKGEKLLRRTLLGPRLRGVHSLDLEQVRQYIREQDAADGASGQF